MRKGKSSQLQKMGISEIERHSANVNVWWVFFVMFRSFRALFKQVIRLLEFTFIFRKQFYFISGLKIISHGNPDNNLESPCVFLLFLLQALPLYLEDVD
jgi:hypothetical protein